MKDRRNRILYWLPRIISIIFILFLSLFALDIFGNNYTFWETVVGLFMHLIPSFILIIILAIAWKRDLVGAIAFIFGGLLYACLVLMNILKNEFQWYYLAWIVQISGVAFVVGILWFLSWKNKKKLGKNNTGSITAKKTFNKTKKKLKKRK